MRGGGAGLSDEQREEMTNREGVASGPRNNHHLHFTNQFIDKSNFTLMQ